VSHKYLLPNNTNIHKSHCNVDTIILFSCYGAIGPVDVNGDVGDGDGVGGQRGAAGGSGKKAGAHGR